MALDELPFRVRELEKATAEIKQNAAVIQQRVNDHEHDFRAFAPLVGAEAELRQANKSLEKSMDRLEQTVSDLIKRIDTNQTTMKVAALGLIGTFITSTGGVLVVILGAGP